MLRVDVSRCRGPRISPARTPKQDWPKQPNNQLHWGHRRNSFTRRKINDEKTYTLSRLLCLLQRSILQILKSDLNAVAAELMPTTSIGFCKSPKDCKPSKTGANLLFLGMAISPHRRGGSNHPSFSAFC